MTKKETPSEQNSDGKKKIKVKKKRTLFQKIVNVFLYIGIGIFVLLLIAFGFSQTSTFKNYLRETLIEQADSVMNGHLYIEQIKGTIFTSLILKNTIINSETDTLLNAETIILKTSPLQLLLKTIYVRDLQIQNADVSLIYDENGELNISKLFPPSEEPDTSESSFPFDIEVADLEFKNVNFSLQNYDKKGSKKFYENLNGDDLQIKNINLQLNAFADINENEFEVNIDKFSAQPNISFFKLNNLEGDFSIKNNLIEVENFNLLTGRSELSINSNMQNFDLFDSTSSLEKANVNLKLTADSLNFDDLTAFVPATEILKGKVYFEINTSGKFSNMKINSLQINYDSTQLKAAGNIRNPDDPNSMYISVDFFNSYINQSDVNKLLPSLNIPAYKELGLIKFDTLAYTGNPLNFNSDFHIKTLKGDLLGSGNLDLRKKEMSYNINFQTLNFDISPFAGIVSNLNSSGNIVGKGTNPENMDAKINFKANGSSLEQIKFDTLRLNTIAQAKKINYKLTAVSDTSSASLNGFFDFTNENVPSYEAKGLVKNLDISDFSNDSTFKTKLNFEIDAEGKNFELDKLNLFVSTKLLSSLVKDVSIDSARAIVDINYDEKGERIINIISDLADITLTGNYSLSQTISLLGGEAQFISNSIQKKIYAMFPSDSVNIPEVERGGLISSVDSASTLEYTIEFKDFNLLSVFLGKNQLEVDGNLNGEIINTLDSVYVNVNSNLDYVKYWGEEGIFFLSDLALKMNVSNALNSTSINDITSNINFSTKRIFMGSEIKNVILDLDLNSSVTDINFSANYEDYARAKILGELNFQNNSIKTNLDSLILSYKNYTIRNKENVDVTYSQNEISFNDFVLSRNDAELNIKGSLLRSGNQDLNINLNNFSGKEISINILGLNPSNALEADINLNSDISGSFSDPVINSKLNIDSITFKEKNFGSLAGKFDYKNKNILTDIKFLESDSSSTSPLRISGKIPYDLSFEAVEERFVESKNMDITFLAEGFDLGTFGNLLPAVKQLHGRLSAEINISGTPEDINPNGYLNINDADFIASANNLRYLGGLKLSIVPNLLTLDSLVIQNDPDTPEGGKMTGTGKAEMSNLNITSSEISVDGKLKVLSDISKGASPTVYGDLVISTNGNVDFRADKEGAYLEAPISIIEADLIFPPTQGGYSNNLGSFIYKFAEDTSNNNNEVDFETLVKLSHERENAKDSAKSVNTKFDYKIDVKVENESKIVFIISKELNQKLTAILKGNFQYEKIGGRPDAQGELKLLEGSTLEFIKTLNATGTIRFESEIDNPFLDVTATYTDYFYPETESASSTGTETNDASVTNEELAAVKIKIHGPLKELDKNLIMEKNNIAVYIGENNINNNIASSQYDASDAVAFIAFGKFPDQSSSNSSDPFSSTTTSIAGSILGGFLNSYLGDYVRSVQLRRVGSTTKVNLSGKINEFRYSVGGATDVFQDLSQANVKIEYPIFQSLLVRLERKEALRESSVHNEMINELGLKYRFEF